jgi:hypothetical protein
MDDLLYRRLQSLIYGPLSQALHALIASPGAPPWSPEHH